MFHTKFCNITCDMKIKTNDNFVDKIFNSTAC